MSKHQTHAFNVVGSLLAHSDSKCEVHFEFLN